MRNYYPLINSMGSGAAAIDADAQAFITAAAITDSTQQGAINTLVTQLKSYGIWTKMKALYPFVGGTASSHKWNLKDPRDLDAAFRLTFNGGWTHSSTGAKPNGTTGYATTKLNENNVMTLGSEHFSFYSRTNTDGLYIDMGLWFGTNNYGSQILSRLTNVCYGYVTDGSNSTISTTDSLGFFIVNRPSTTQLKIQKNSSITTFSSNAINKVNLEFSLGARNNNNAIDLYSPREMAFATIGDGLTDTEAANFYTVVQSFNTTLNRQV